MNQDISATTSIGSSELRRTLQSLACAKYKILTKSPKGREIDDTDSFTYNYAFTCPLAKIKIQTVANKVESAEEKKETDSRVDEARNQLCDVRFVSRSRARWTDSTTCAGLYRASDEGS